MAKRVIRLTESELKNIIKRTINEAMMVGLSDLGPEDLYNYMLSVKDSGEYNPKELSAAIQGLLDIKDFFDPGEKKYIAKAAMLSKEMKGIKLSPTQAPRVEKKRTETYRAGDVDEKNAEWAKKKKQLKYRDDNKNPDTWGVEAGYQKHPDGQYSQNLRTKNLPK